MLPIIRTFISLPAGVARMPFWRFTVFTLARLHPLGADAGRDRREVGDHWEEWRDYLHYGDYVVLAAIVGGAHLPADPPASRRRRQARPEAGP